MAEKNTSFNENTFPIIVLCASAGGLKAFQGFFDNMPPDTGMAFVVMQHQQKNQESILAEILQRHTTMSVVKITANLEIKPNQIYVVPSAYETTARNRRFQLSDFQKNSGWPHTIDQLLTSLAQDQGERVVAIILSGAGLDSVKGAKAIIDKGGRVIAQTPASAMQDTMPRNIIDAGLEDTILPPEQIPQYLLNIYDIDAPDSSRVKNLPDDITEGELKRVIKRLRRLTKQDFENYKISTLRRQIARRMAILHIHSVVAYLAYMNEHADEADQLARDLLIHVTSFFRDAHAFEALKTTALLPMLQQMDIDTVFRVWVPGCATGEEAVSVAILIHECLGELDMQDMEVRIFASDANKLLIQRGRAGFYPMSIQDHIEPSRLNDHFIQQEDGYRVRNHISRMILWSEHNLIDNPPFSRIHLISCRNVLIYFQKRLQDKIYALFQFALRPNGILFLGSSETIPLTTDAFEPINTRAKIYRCTSNDPTFWLQLKHPLFTKIPDQQEYAMTSPEQNRDDNNYELELIRNNLLSHYQPTCLIVDENYYVRYSIGEVDRYLQYVSGTNIQRTVLETARKGLDSELTIALHEAFAQDDETIVREGVWLKTNGDERIITLTVKPIQDKRLGSRLKLVIFDVTLQGKDVRGLGTLTERDEDATSSEIIALRQELTRTKEALQSTTQALQVKSEELTTYMEEIRSANEEVQTTNEELRTSKEELESMNEELNTLNAQLTDQNEELTHANNTLHNFMQSSEVVMIFLDNDLNIREYTSVTSDIFNFRKGDLGRPLSEITTGLDYDSLVADTEQVLNTLNHADKELQTEDRRWYRMYIRPYRTTGNVIEGVVLTFSDITSQKKAQLLAEQTTNYMAMVFDTIENALLELDGDLRVLSANQSFYELFQVTEEVTAGRLLYSLGNGQWDIPELRRLLTEIIPAEAIIRDYEVQHKFPGIGMRTMHLNARQIVEANRILLVITDVSKARPDRNS